MLFKIRSIGTVMVTTITERKIEIWNGEAWCNVIIDIDVPIEEIKLNSFSQLCVSKWCTLPELFRSEEE